MGKSLTEVAKSVLLKEGAVPSVSSSDNNPDRDATKKTANAATLKPNATAVDGTKKLDGEVQDLGSAVTSPTDERKGPSNAAKGTSKDTSKSAKSSVPAETRKKQEQVNEDEDLDNSPEISEELEAFIDNLVAEGKTEEEIKQAIAENFEIVEEDMDNSPEISEELESFIEAALEKGLSEEEIEQAIAENFEIVEEDMEENIEEENQLENTVQPEPEIKIDMKEDMNALFAGEELSEDFKEKATTIFEAAVRAKIQDYLTHIKEAYAETLSEQVENIKEEIATNVDDYLNYVVEQWMSENEVAIESNLRTEITEDFISGLRNLFMENYIDIPEESVPVVEEIVKKLEETENQLEEQIEKNVILHKILNESKQNEIVLEACEGLTATQQEKLKSLLENVEYNSDEEFATKVQTLKENYFPSAPKTSTVLDNNNTDAQDNKGMIIETNSNMDKYVRTLGKKLPN